MKLIIKRKIPIVFIIMVLFFNICISSKEKYNVFITIKIYNIKDKKEKKNKYHDIKKTILKSLPFNYNLIKNKKVYEILKKNKFHRYKSEITYKLYKELKKINIDYLIIGGIKKKTNYFIGVIRILPISYKIKGKRLKIKENTWEKVKRKISKFINNKRNYHLQLNQLNNKVEKKKNKGKKKKIGSFISKLSLKKERLKLDKFKENIKNKYNKILKKDNEKNKDKREKENGNVIKKKIKELTSNPFIEGKKDNIKNNIKININNKILKKEEDKTNNLKGKIKEIGTNIKEKIVKTKEKVEKNKKEKILETKEKLEKAKEIIIKKTEKLNNNLINKAKNTLIIPKKEELRKGWFGETLIKGLKKYTREGEYIWEKDGSIMVYVPAGEYFVDIEEKVNVPAYYIDKYEVTNSQFCEFLNSVKEIKDENGHIYIDLDSEDCGIICNIHGEYVPKKGAEFLPVIRVSWYGAKSYAKWIGKDLPTKYQWEKAAKGGLKIPDWKASSFPIPLIDNPFVNRVYPWGEGEIDIPFYRANYKNKGDGYKWLAPISVFEGIGDSPYKCSNLIGNVWEWCNDWFKKDIMRLCKGGSWATENIDFLRIHNDFGAEPQKFYNDLGFRCVLNLGNNKK